MGLKRRIIPCLDVDNGRVVKGVNFVNIRDAGNPVELALRYRDDGADEITFLDISATIEGKSTLKRVIRAIAYDLDIPFTVGGGIRTFEDAREILYAGADKIAINSAAVANPNLISEIADCFGRQSVVIAIDSNEVDNIYKVYTHGGRKQTSLDAVDWAKRAADLGAGEILLTSMNRDGTKAGFDIALTRRVCDSVSIPVIASGGAGNPDDFVHVLTLGKADAALAASIFHFKEYTIQRLKDHLMSKGVAVRI